jgi:ankyrin repeat protein
LIPSVSALRDPVSAFLEAACVPREDSHASGTLDIAETILKESPEIAISNVYTAATLADTQTVRRFLSLDRRSATAKGGVHGWDALTYLCFSRYLRLDPRRSDAFVKTATLLLDAGASAQTGWYEMIDHPNPRPILESALYGAAAIARHPELTRLLLERGADPNDEETPYHVPESYDNTVTRILLEAGTLNELSLACMLVRKADWHDEDGLKLLLEYGADPNVQPRFGVNGLHQVLRRDNSLSALKLLLDHGGNPALKSNRDGLSAAQIAARRGRADALKLFEERPDCLDLPPLDRLIAACAKADRREIENLLSVDPILSSKLLAEGGTLLAEFAGNGNVDGLRCLVDLGVPVDSQYPGDGYFEIAPESTALHVAAWRAQPKAAAWLIQRGAPVNAMDAKARTPLQLAIRACVDSHWMNRRTPEIAAALLNAGASLAGVDVPTGYGEIDELLQGSKRS